MDKSLFNLTLLQMKKVIDAQIDLNHLFLFECYLEGITPSSQLSAIKVDSWKQGLLRKNWLDANENPTEYGKSLYDAIKSEIVAENPKEIIKEKKAKRESDFAVWWACFPSTDLFDYNGKKFTGSRTLRVKKEECEQLFNKLVMSNEYTAENIINATKFDVENKKRESYKQGKNVLSFLQNSATYLRQQSFDGYVGMKIEEIRKTNIPENSSNIVDI